MREEEFKAWLARRGHSISTQNTQTADARRLELHFGDLDEAYELDQLDGLKTTLRYSKEDERNGRDNPAPFPINGGLYANLSHFRSTLNYYAGFRMETDGADAAPEHDTADKRVTLFDDDGTAHWPVRQLNQQTGRIAFRIRGATNLTADAHETTDIVEVARALLKEGRSVRVLRSSNGRRPYLSYGRQKLTSYELSPDIAAAIGLPVKASVSNSNPAPFRQPVVQIKPQEETAMPSPTNLILYGPPGTGKTYTTAREAVRLCDGTADYPDDDEGRMALMDRYRALQQKGRIGFVTFHQNFSYEDFVEGLRPSNGSNDGNAEGEGGGPGFTLEPQDGVFKQMAELAASNRGRAIDLKTPVIDHNRKIFKMSLGRSWASEDDVIYQDAIREGYVVLGWGGDVDWSDPRFDEWEAIKERWRQDHPEASGNDPNMSQMFAFRINMQVGSLVVISDGNRKFRAIGEITGSYRFVPGPNGEYNHRRSVRWLWHGESLPRERIYNKELSQVSAYQMNSRHVNWEGLEQIVASGGDAVATSGMPEPHVLVIDEINRANISKVFGELITLLEPDKRVGMPNALSVRLPYSKTEFGVPPNLHIIGTMNTADRSIALLDTALRRRFIFREMAPRPDLLGSLNGIDLRKVLTVINERIEYLIDREHRIGHAFFMGCAARADVDAVMRDKVIPLLQEYFFEDWSRIRAVLGSGFIVEREIAPPPGIEGPARKSWAVRTPFAANAYERLVSNAPPSANDDASETGQTEDSESEEA